MKDNRLLTEVEKEKNDISDDSIKMSISAEGSRYLIANLTNLYSYPETAILREYTANALDSHVQAKQKRPIEVTIKDTETEVLINSYQKRKIKSFDLMVEDFGIGMSRDDIVNIYSQYGASTKRDTNTQVGAYGLGAKSALSLVDKFSIISVKDSIEIVFNIVKGEDGVGVIYFVSEESTTKPNGVKIHIVADGVNIPLGNAARDFFATWSPGSVLVNGKEPYHVANDPGFLKISVNDNEILGYLKVKDDQYQKETLEEYYKTFRPTGGNKVSLGGILYPIASQDLSNFYEINPFIQKIFDSSYIDVLVGSIDLTPPREGIRYSNKTLSTLKRTFKDFITFAQATVQEHIDSLSRADAINFQFANSDLITALFTKETVKTVNPPSIYRNVRSSGWVGSHVMYTTWRGEKITTGIVFNGASNSLNSKREKIIYEMVTTTSKLKRDKLTDLSAINLLTKHSSHYQATYYRTLRDVNALSLLEDTSFTRNARDYAKSELNGMANMSIIVTNDDVNVDPWLKALAPDVTLEEIISKAKEYRAELSKQPRVVKELAYPTWEYSTGLIQLKLISDIDSDKVLYIDRADGFITDNYFWSGISSISRNLKNTINHLSFKRDTYKEFFLMLDQLLPQVEDIIFLDKKSSNVLEKKLPVAVSLAEELHNYLLSLSYDEQNYVNIYAHSIKIGADGTTANFDLIQTLKKNSKALIEYGLDSIADPEVRKMVTYFGETVDEKSNAINKFLARSLLKVSESNLDDFMDLKKQAPLMFSKVFNAKHMVSYLNSIDFNEKSYDTVVDLF